MGKTQFTIMEVIMIIIAYRLIFVLKCTRSITLSHTLSLSPLAPVASALSLPARSTKLSLLTFN